MILFELIAATVILAAAAYTSEPIPAVFACIGSASCAVALVLAVTS